MLYQSQKLKESELKRRDLFQAPLSLSPVENKKSSEKPWNGRCCYPDSNRVLSSNSSPITDRQYGLYPTVIHIAFLLVSDT
jgi:hypothetical protein